MNASTGRLPTSTEPLVEALEMRLRCVDLIGWAQITECAAERGLSFVDLRLLLALSTVGGARGVPELARLSGLPLQGAYPGVNHLRGRGYLDEERRRYSLNEQGRELVEVLGAAHRHGIQAYVDGLTPDERHQLAEGIGR